MANDINSVVLVGRLTRDAELRYANSGTAICVFSIASNYSRKQGDSWSEEVSYFDAVLMGRSAESVHKYLVKGKQVGIQGELRQNRWEKEGQARSKVEVFVNKLELLGGGSDGGGRGGQDRYDTNTGSPDRGPGQDSGRSSSGGHDSGSEFEDDVPF